MEASKQLLETEVVVAVEWAKGMEGIPLEAEGVVAAAMAARVECLILAVVVVVDCSLLVVRVLPQDYLEGAEGGRMPIQGNLQAGLRRREELEESILKEMREERVDPTEALAAMVRAIAAEAGEVEIFLASAAQGVTLRWVPGEEVEGVLKGDQGELLRILMEEGEVAGVDPLVALAVKGDLAVAVAEVAQKLSEGQGDLVAVVAVQVWAVLGEWVDLAAPAGEGTLQPFPGSEGASEGVEVLQEMEVVEELD
jgi:hypothetical protein